MANFFDELLGEDTAFLKKIVTLVDQRKYKTAHVECIKRLQEINNKTNKHASVLKAKLAGLLIDL